MKPPTGRAMNERRPNFILFVTDQQRADHLGCYGHPVLRTPAIDGLARRGAAFDNCHVASPVCMPNRASLMTGRMPSLHGVRNERHPALDRCGDLRGPPARRRLPHGAHRQEPPAELHRPSRPMPPREPDGAASTAPAAGLPKRVGTITARPPTGRRPRPRHPRRRPSTASTMWTWSPGTGTPAAATMPGGSAGGSRTRTGCWARRTSFRTIMSVRRPCARRCRRSSTRRATSPGKRFPGSMRRAATRSS